MVDLATSVGDVRLKNPVLTASGTSGHGAELHAYVDLSLLGGVVVKSLVPYEWAGNPAPRMYPLETGMINSIGLPGPGVEAWLENDLPELLATGATVVASIWGRTIDDYAKGAAMLSNTPAGVVAVEVNVSCPNLEDRSRMFGHSAEITEEVMKLTESVNRPRWAKLSPNTHDIVGIAQAAKSGGADALVLSNTFVGIVIDVETRRPVLGAGRGGVSGPGTRPIVVRAVYDVHAAMPDMPIVGVGGVAQGVHAVEYLMAGASAVEVGTATFVEPRATGRILNELEAWCDAHGVASVRELVGAAHHDPA